MSEPTLVSSVNADLATAMRARDAQTLGALRMLKTALTNKRVEFARDLTEVEAQQVVAALVKQRRDSIEQFTAAGREDLAAKEHDEVAVLDRYLPPPIDTATIDAAVAAEVSATGAQSLKDMGRVMKGVMGRFAGQLVDGKLINERVRAALGG